MVLLNKRLKAFSLIEVLVSLAIVSFSILYLLILAANLTRKATINKLQIQMSTIASGILEQAKSTLYTKQRDQNWNTLLNNNTLKINPNTKEVETASNCNFNDNPLNSNCPSVNELDQNQYSFLGYIIKAEQVNNNLFKLTIKIACKEVTSNSNCPNGLRPVIYETYITKY